MIEFNSDPSAYIERFSKEVQEAFMEVVKTKYGYQSFIPVNRAYNEYIKDPYHTHLNSTKWATLSDFAYDLEKQGLVELAKDVDALGKEQIMIKVIDKERASREQMEKLNSKENRREAERKREEKELEKMIKDANKLQAKQRQNNKQDEEVKKEVRSQGIFTFQVSMDSKGPIVNEEQEGTKEIIRPKISLFQQAQSSDSLSELAILQQKTKKSSIDKVFHQQQQSSSSPLQQTWIRDHLIVKIKKEGSSFHKLKGEITKINTQEGKITVKLENGQVKEFHENELTKVIPGEGGVAWLLKEKKIGQIKHIDLKSSTATVTCRDSQGNKEKFTVKLDDLCKYNTNQ